MTNSKTPTLALVLSALLALVAFAATAAGASAKTKTIQVSVRSNGAEGPASSDFPGLSGDGRYSCFESLNPLTGHDAGMDDDVFVHDRRTGKTKRASVKSNGKEVPGAFSADSCSLSGDGHLVAFRSGAPLVGSDTNGTEDIYVHNMKTGKTKRASLLSSGDQVFADDDNPRISANGRFVAWDTDGAFSIDDINSFKDVYRHDLKTGKTEQVSLRNDGGQAGGAQSGDSTEPSLSADGQKVAFQSYDNQMTADTDYQFQIDRDVFVRNLKNDTTARASLSSNGDEPTYPMQVPPSNVNSSHPVISGDGKFVAFTSFGVYNGNDDNLNFSDVYIHAMSSGKTSLVSLKSNGNQGTGESGYTDPHPIEISATGRFVAFDSQAQLGAQDTDSSGDVYVRDRLDHTTKLVTLRSNGKPLGNVDAALPALSADGKWVAWASADPYVGSDTNGDSDIFERGPLR
jgi:Tol biopolymer transport system component